ncbi:MAG: hypothetical protein AAF471_00225 [Myxococcota bacterium]
MKSRKRLAWPVLSSLFLLVSCFSLNKSLLSRRHQHLPVPTEEVYVYSPGEEEPENYEKIAILYAKSDELVAESSIIDKFREESGKLGANAIILKGELVGPDTGDRVANAVFGTPSERRGQAIAIYVSGKK